MITLFSRDAKRSAAPLSFACSLAASVAVLLTLLTFSGCSERSAPASSTTVSKAAAGNLQSNEPTAAVENVAANSGAADIKPDVKTHATAAPAEIAPAKSQAARDITFDTIKFDMQKEAPFERSMITPAIEKLGNSKVRIRGYMLPGYVQSGLTQFVLVRDNMQCCFGPGAALFDCIVVQMDPGKTAEFTTHPVVVEGVFSIREIPGSENKCLAIYHLDAERVQ
jgi:hypothetical protein